LRAGEGKCGSLQRSKKRKEAELFSLVNFPITIKEKKKKRNRINYIPNKRMGRSAARSASGEEAELGRGSANQIAKFFPRCGRGMRDSSFPKTPHAPLRGGRKFVQGAGNLKLSFGPLPEWRGDLLSEITTSIDFL